MDSSSKLNKKEYEPSETFQNKTKAVAISNELLAKALEKPVLPDEQLRKEASHIVRKGRCAYKLPVY